MTEKATVFWSFLLIFLLAECHRIPRPRPYHGSKTSVHARIVKHYVTQKWCSSFGYDRSQSGCYMVTRTVVHVTNPLSRPIIASGYCEYLRSGEYYGQIALEERIFPAKSISTLPPIEETWMVPPGENELSVRCYVRWCAHRRCKK